MDQVRELSDDTSHRGPEAAMILEGESVVVLAYRRPPVQHLPGVVRTIREGPRALALTDDEWQALGLEEPPDA